MYLQLHIYKNSIYTHICVYVIHIYTHVNTHPYIYIYVAPIIMLFSKMKPGRRPCAQLTH